MQANGQTRFVALIVPDKLTAYSKFVARSDYAELSLLASFLSTYALPAPRLDQALQAAIEQGETDVYLPNDTHWGYRGHQIAARAVAEFIKPTNEFPSQRIADSASAR